MIDSIMRDILTSIGALTVVYFLLKAALACPPIEAALRRVFDWLRYTLRCRAKPPPVDQQSYVDSFSINCRHTFYPFIKIDEEEEIND